MHLQINEENETEKIQSDIDEQTITQKETKQKAKTKNKKQMILI